MTLPPVYKIMIPDSEKSNSRYCGETIPTR
ncbi:hypothetical protein [Salmonella phage SD-1_S14]|nr:hypothetical protein [Salmonella phage SD-2_S15]WPK19165.1 hypothetical protein [Salmonella phage SD-6_S16]WPK19834.1 hypothetical protein [Salmonella phage SD-1_S14]WPK20861.1 hypothetical protein [Salmonella phage SD-15_S21]